MNNDQARLYRKILQTIAKDCVGLSPASERVPKGEQKVHVSELISPCMRRVYYSRMLPDRGIDMDTLMRFWYGQLVHSRPILRSHEVCLEYCGIVGHIDEYEDGILLEKKTCLKPPAEPKPDHVKQVEYYKVILSRNGFEVKNAFVVYFPRSPGKMGLTPVLYEVRMRPVDNVEAEMLFKREVLVKAVVENCPPSPSPGDACLTCPYIAECHR